MLTVKSVVTSLLMQHHVLCRTSPHSSWSPVSPVSVGPYPFCWVQYLPSWDEGARSGIKFTRHFALYGAAVTFRTPRRDRYYSCYNCEFILSMAYLCQPYRPKRSALNGPWSFGTSILASRDLPCHPHKVAVFIYEYSNNENEPGEPLTWWYSFCWRKRYCLSDNNNGEK